MVAVASSAGRLTEAAEREIRAAMRDVIHVDRPDEELVFAKWAAADVADVNSLVFRFSRLWSARLDLSERREFYDSVERVAWASGAADDLQLSALQKLRDRLELSPAGGAYA
jgi:hypothetical protein